MTIRYVKTMLAIGVSLLVGTLLCGGVFYILQSLVGGAVPGGATLWLVLFAAFFGALYPSFDYHRRLFADEFPDEKSTRLRWHYFACLAVTSVIMLSVNAAVRAVWFGSGR